MFRTIQMLGCLLTKVKPTLDKKGVIYQVPCRDYSKVYIGETARKLNTRLTEHKQHCRLLQPSKLAVAEHAITEDHNIDFDKAFCLLMNNITAKKNQGSTAHQKTA